MPRTLLDLGAVLQRDELRSAMRQAEQLRLTDRLWLGDLLERYPRKPGSPTLRAVVEDAQRGMNVVRSDLEELFQAFLIRAGIPLPSTNVLVEGYEVDCTWADAGLVVELDSRNRRLEARVGESCGSPGERSTTRRVPSRRISGSC